jgi:hypothetical protein
VTGQNIFSPKKYTIRHYEGRLPNLI